MISLKTNMGNAWFQRNEYIKARDYFHLALSMFDQVTDPIKETDVYYRIGLSYRKTGQNDSARLYLNHSLEIAKRIQSLKDQTNALLELSKIDSISGEMHDAMANYQLGIALRDSMWNIQHRSRIAELQIIHETEKSEIRISELQQLNTKNQIVILLMGIAAILLVAAMFFVALFMRKRRLATQQQLIIQHQQTEFMKRDRDAKRRELTEKAHTLVMVNDLVQKLESKLNQMLAKADDKTAEALNEVLKIVKSLDRNEDVWNEFLSRFDELNNEFIIRLTEKYPDLTHVEKRICAMLKLDLSNKEIADITKRSVRTIEFYRGNIRKKMVLGSTENIVAALSNI
jgi:DNA-binding CsgD family transcriptional regulator